MSTLASAMDLMAFSTSSAEKDGLTVEVDMSLKLAP